MKENGSDRNGEQGHRETEIEEERAKVGERENSRRGGNETEMMTEK